MTDPLPALPTADAVAAILVTPDRRFLLQQRDELPGIWYPGCWSLFGGGIDPGETELEALRRELREEIGFVPEHASLFTRFHFDLGFAGGRVHFRTFFEVPILPEAMATMTLGEGRAMQLMPADEALAAVPTTGYDQFALYLYVHRARIRPRRPDRPG